MTDVDVRTPTLEHLKRTAQREHELATEAANSALEHAILAGEALDAAREMLPSGEWEDWVVSNTSISPQTARRYIRIAIYKSHLPTSEPLSPTRAWAHLRGLPATADRNRASRADPEVLDEVDRLAKTEASVGEIAQAVGLSWDTVKERIDPEYRRRRKRDQRRQQKRRRAAATALREKEERQERDRLAKQVGGEQFKAYGKLRESITFLDRAIDGCPNPEQRAALREALSHAHRAEDEITKANKIDRAGT